MSEFKPGSIGKEFKDFRLEVLEEALKACQSQVVEWQPNDEYRRGQHRGASDCVEMVKRLILEPTK